MFAAAKASRFREPSLGQSNDHGSSGETHWVSIAHISKRPSRRHAHGQRGLTFFFFSCSPNVPVFFSSDPLHIVKGRGQYFYDEKGQQILDCINNVCHGEIVRGKRMLCLHPHDQRRPLLDLAVPGDEQSRD